MRSVRRAAHRKLAREVAVRPRRVLPESVPQPAHALRETPPSAALAKNCQLPSHRATLLRAASRENPNRDPNKGHAALRQFVLLAIHGDHVTYNVAAAGGGLIFAIRLPAVPAEPAVRLPEVPARSRVRRRSDVVQ